MVRRTFLRVGSALLLGLALAAPLLARSGTSRADIHLRRATFDPLIAAPNVSDALKADDSSLLRLVQLNAPPDETTAATLEAAGLHPLLYIPDNAYLVRASASAATTRAALRWSGRFELGYKLPAALDALLTGGDATTHTLRLLAAPDADAAIIAAAVQSAGGTVLARADTLNGSAFQVTLAGAALRGLLRRDDVLWAEPSAPLRLLNDRARTIIGVTRAQQQFGWLNGEGQIVAVTDTGLDQQSSLSADFSGRIAAAFTPKDMSSSCTTTNWSDYDGHGTHVSGTVLGSGALSPAGASFAGVAPGAKLVVEAISSSNSGGALNCLREDNSFLSKAYNAGARVQNASFGGSTGGTSTSPQYGGYDSFAQLTDDYLWQHKDHLLVVSAGNEGADADGDGVIDRDSINSPATAKNVLAVGASENDRPPTSTGCGASASSPQNLCYAVYGQAPSGIIPFGEPFASNFISDNPAGMVAFSSRGPADDGRIKPEIVAPGSNIISTRSHNSNAAYQSTYNADYAYDSGTSMSAPMVSGAAALLRQWLARERSISAPSAALVKALLLDGATNIAPGQYGTGAQREIPEAWPNNVAGWGRASVADAVGLDGATIWLKDEASGLTTNQTSSYSLDVAAGQTLRVTLAWTDYPATPAASKTLVNDLDLELQAPDGSIVAGNASADLPSACRASGADRCNNVESVALGGAQAGTYTLRVRGAAVAHGPQPFALVARLSGGSAPTATATPTASTEPTATVSTEPTATAAPTATPGFAALDAPTLQAQSTGAAIVLNWTAVSGATRYELQRDSDASFASATSTTATTASLTVVVEVGSYTFRVRSCNSDGCGAWSNTATISTTEAPSKLYVPLAGRT